MKHSEAMKQAAKEDFNCHKTNIEQIRSIARAYATKRECSVQEIVHLLMPELWLQKTFQVLFLEIAIYRKIALDIFIVGKKLMIYLKTALTFLNET